MQNAETSESCSVERNVTLCRYDYLTKIGVMAHKSSLRRWEKVGRFPKRIKLGDHSVAWLKNEVDDHIAELAANRGEEP